MAASTTKGEQHFLDKHRNELINRITMIHPVLDHLLQGGLLTQEQYDIVKESVPLTQEKMRVLYKYIRGWGTCDKDVFYEALRTNNPRVIKHLEETSQSEKWEKTSPGDPIEDLRVQYMTEIKQRFQCVKEHNSRIGEAVSMSRRYTRLVMVKRYQSKKEKEHEITSLGFRHQQMMDQRSSDECTCTSPQTLFNPNDQGVVPKIVVLQGPAGIGKTMTSKKIMLDWASGNLYQDNFSFVFYLSCRELNTITEKTSLVWLLSRTSKVNFPENTLQAILSNPRKLLFIIDGFDEVRWTPRKDFTMSGSPLQETHPEFLLRRLVSKHTLCEASLIITTRPLALEKLDELIKDVCSRHVEVLGFTAEDCEEYFHNSFNNEDDAEKALSMIQGNEVLYTMCAIPITCWIVCTVLKQEITNGLDLIRCRTITSVYLLYLKGLIKYHGRKQPVHECLKKLGALAKEGVINRQILFEEEDLERHGLSMLEVESVFLNENIFHQDIDSSACYSFIHLSMQEFFAAIYYLLEQKEVDVLPEICNGKTLSEFSSSIPHLSLTLQFLFGLTNEKQLKELSKITKHDISVHAISAIRHWLAAEDPLKYRTLTISCLYETQDEEFVRAVMCRSKDLEFHLAKGKAYNGQLTYCLRFCPDINALNFVFNTMRPKDLNVLSPFLHKCTYLKIACYIRLSSVPCNVLGDLIVNSQRLRQLDLSGMHLKDNDVDIMCEALQNPRCTLQELRLFCNLSPFTCEKLHLVITMGRPITELYVMFHVDFTVEVSKAEELCQKLRLPGCIFLEDSILHDEFARLFYKNIYFAYQKSWCRPNGPAFRGGGIRPCLGAAAYPRLFGLGAPFGPRTLGVPSPGFI